MAMVVKTVMTDPRIEGNVMRKKVCNSPAPSMRAASVSSIGTPLMAADRITMAKPIWSQTKMTMRTRVFLGISWSQGTASPPKEVTDGIENPDLGLALGAPLVDEAPDHRGPGSRDAERDENERLGQ